MMVSFAQYEFFDWQTACFWTDWLDHLFINLSEKDSFYYK